ncbi:hypothetical protein OHC33_004736 [Knufia fluminis]|uniref:Uncharacterized protein n=1 Tax=Knufia fluminis TaxID=191047 RepID=A0AAN8EZ21_9EURO|nr:hypothetical protein OHC33_004736 [Knufia fluminis]
MSNPSLPSKPTGSMPSMKDAKKANPPPALKTPSQIFFGNATIPKKDNRPAYKKNKEAAKKFKEQLNKKSTSTDDNNDKARPGQKRKSRDDDESTPKSPEKRNKTFVNPSPLVAGIAGLPAPPQGPLPPPYPFFNNFNTAPAGHGHFVPMLPPALRFDKATNSFVMKGPEETPNLQTSKPAPKKAAPPQKATTTTNGDGSGIIRSKGHQINAKAADRYNFRKRSAPEADGTEEDAGAPSKRARTDNGDGEDGEITAPTNTSMSEIVKATKKKNKHRSHAKSKPKSEVAANMRDFDLISHYTPNPEALARRKAIDAAKPPPPPPKKLTDLPREIRDMIWDRVFADESYNFKLKKQCGNRDDKKYMVATKPKSFGALSICKFLNNDKEKEVKKQMYKSIRLEIEFGRLRPHAMRDFMNTITAHPKIGLSERIFFIKKFGLQKVNFGLFTQAKEIVSTHWTVEGDGKMDEDDYKNNRIDPQFILTHPPTKDKLKGLKERRFWRDQEAASQRYARHIAGWCHPDGKDPNAPDYNPLTDKKNCPFGDACENLKDTKFCMVVKYKYGCIKGRHARHKEAFYDFYPTQGDRLVQTVAPKSKFHKKCGKKGCKDLGDQNAS